MLSAAPQARSTLRLSAAQAAALLHDHRSGALPQLALFDVRAIADFEAGHIDGARHLDQSGFAGLLPHLPRQAPVLVYCYHGNASQGWAATFADFRFAQAYSVDGGYDALAAALAPRQRPAARNGEASAELMIFLTAHRFDLEDLDAPREHGLTPLMRAALAGRAPLVAELVALGVEVNRRNRDGNNALWLACVAGSADSIRQLVCSGADIDNRNAAGATCLMYCASAGKADMLALLLECGADPLLTDQDDARAIDLAASRECLRLLRQLPGGSASR